MGKREEQELKQLRAKVRELELMVKSQQKVIEIMKSMPGVGKVRPKDGDTKSKSRLHGGVQDRNRSSSAFGSTREPNADSSGAECDNENLKVVEKELQ